MMLTEEIELPDGLPVAHIRSLSSIAISDLHLGYEGMMARNGVLSPKINLLKIKKTISKALDVTGADRVIVDGDIKNEFSNVDVEEFNELYDFITYVKGTGADLVLIKGNHDNFVERYGKSFGLKIYRQEAAIDDYLFFHGEEMPINSSNAKTLVMGHEHPAIGVYNKSGRKEKLKCFLYGKYMRYNLLVLPAMNYFSTGTEVNMEPKSDLLAPIFKKLDVDSMRAIAIGYGSTEDFGKVGKLRNLA